MKLSEVWESLPEFINLESRGVILSHVRDQNSCQRSVLILNFTRDFFPTTYFPTTCSELLHPTHNKKILWAFKLHKRICESALWGRIRFRRSNWLSLIAGALHQPLTQQAGRAGFFRGVWTQWGFGRAAQERDNLCLRKRCYFSFMGRHTFNERTPCHRLAWVESQAVCWLASLEVGWFHSLKGGG